MTILAAIIVWICIEWKIEELCQFLETFSSDKLQQFYRPIDKSHGNSERASAKVFQFPQFSEPNQGEVMME